jgi:hypothetical protein
MSLPSVWPVDRQVHQIGRRNLAKDSARHDFQIMLSSLANDDQKAALTWLAHGLIKMTFGMVDLGNAEADYGRDNW